MSAPQNLNLHGVLSETKRIINAHSRHFLALSVLFLLPLSFSLIIYPFLSLPTSIPSHYTLSFFSDFGPLPEFDEFDPTLPTLYILFVTLFSLFATSSITYSTYHGFYGRPVKFVSSVKYVILSFFPLFVTLVATQLVVGLFLIVSGGVGVLALHGLSLIGVDVGYGSGGFMVLAVVIGALVTGVLVYFQVEWSLASVVVVVESNWGFSALRRSSYLVKGMRRVVFMMLLLFSFLLGVLSMMCSSLVPDGGQINGGWVGWAFVVFQTILCAGFMTVLMLYSVAANAVLFMYCKAARGELAFDIAEEFSREYISLPFDDGKVPHIVYVV